MGIRARIGWGSCALALGRRSSALALAAALLLAAASTARAQGGADAKPADAAEAAAAAAAALAPQQPTATAVLPVTATAGYESLGAGLRAWMIERLEAAGVDVLPLSRLDAGLKAIGTPIRLGADATRLADGRVGAGTALFTVLWVDGPEVELRLHAHSTADGQLLIGARERGRVADLPRMAEHLLAQTAGGLGFDAGKVAGAPPRLSDWAALARARARAASSGRCGC